MDKITLNCFYENFQIDLVEKDKDGKYFLKVNNVILSKSKIDQSKIYLKCTMCNFIKYITFAALLHYKRDNRMYNGFQFKCNKCRLTGAGNPFFGKKHSEESCRKIVNNRKRRYFGSDNPFYGKRVSDEHKKKLSKICSKHIGDKNSFYGKKHSEKSRQKMSESLKKYYKENPDAVENNRQRTIEYLKNGKYFKTKPEQIVEEYFISNNINYKYNFILDGRFQYDFLVNNSIVVEVHGDYWHANPKFYKVEEYTERQKFKVNRDLEKKTFAEAFGYRILYIWEDDIINGIFTALEELNEI